MVTRRSYIWFTATLLLAVVITLAPLPQRASPPARKLIHVDARQYAYTPGEIQVNTGDIVTIELASTDVVHGLYLDGYGLSMTADPGQTEQMTFTADRPGAFRFRCNVTCGAMHPFMIGKLIIGRNETFLRAIGLAVLGAVSIFFMPRKQG